MNINFYFRFPETKKLVLVKAILVDDDPMARKILQSLCEGSKLVELRGIFSSPLEAINFLNENKIDLLFLDVEMPEMTGLDVIKALKEKPVVILTTAREQYAIEAFDLEVVDYLVKPITMPRFMKAVLKAKERLRPTEEAQQTVFIKSDGAYINLILSEISVVEGNGDYITIYVAGQAKRYTIYETLSNFQNKLSADFLRVHRSYIINKSFIQSIEDNTLSVDKKPIPIGVSYREQVYKILKLNK